MTTLLDAIKVELTISREALLQEAALVPDQLFDERSSDDVWSTAEILDHLVAVERRIGGMFAKSIENVADSDTVPAHDASSVILALEGLFAERAAGPIKSSHVPERGLTRAMILGALDETRTNLFRLIDAAHGIDLSGIVQPHPVLGDLNMYQFLLFVARHEDRHRAQITRQREQMIAH